MNRKKFATEIVKFLPQRLRENFFLLTDSQLKRLQEIRLRIHCPLNLVFSDADLFLSKGELHSEPKRGEMIRREDLGQAILFLSNHSLYAMDEELRQGFITIPGGHRVGFVGHGVLKDGMIKQLKEISGINFRITREVRGCADRVIFMILKDFTDIHQTMIISPPRCGKTTLLRELICLLSNGFSQFSGMKVGVVDERSELAGTFQGIPRHNLGVRTDVLDHCPKTAGLYLLIRSMSPQVIATDEIGNSADVAALKEAANAGIRLLTTVHGRDPRELLKRPILRDLLVDKLFTRYIVLSNRLGVGTIEGIYDEDLRLISQNDLELYKGESCYG